jgi:hypothetical protein
MSGNTLWILATAFMAGLFCYGIYLSHKEKRP